MFEELSGISLPRPKGCMMTAPCQAESSNWEMESLKKEKVETLDLKSTTDEMKNPLEGPRRDEQQRKSGLENGLTETTWDEGQRGNEAIRTPQRNVTPLTHQHSDTPHTDT
jgi:hypothetical protein